MNRFRALTLLLLLLLVQTPAYLYTSTSNETVGVHPDFPHARVVVTRVVDGDTVHITPPVCVAGEYRTVVRLADIDAPELDQPSGENSRNALIDLLAQYGNIVYLDIANYTREAGCANGAVDTAGRAVAVLYVRVNSTYLLNVNKWMVENNYASTSDSPYNDFDPAKWSLYLEYHVTAEKMPTIEKITLYTGYIVNATSWGVKVATTPDRRYLAVAFSEGAPSYAARVCILDHQSNSIKNLTISGSNVWRGMIDIASNDTGFLVVWTDAGITRTARFSYIPIVGEPTAPRTIQDGITYSYHPLVTYYHNGTVGYWIIVYGKQTPTYTRINVTWYFLNLTFHRNWWWGVAPGGNSAAYRVGHDVVSGVIHDPATRKFIVIARNVTETTGHDIIGITGEPSTTFGIFVGRFNVDNRTGDQGPEPDLVPDTYYTYYNLFPSIHTKLLSSGGYVLTVYNESDKSLSYAIIDISTTPPSVVKRETLFDRGVSTTFYPWIASSDSHWLVVWSAGGWVNASFVKPSEPFIESYIMVADSNASYVRAVYDSGSKLYAIVYAVTDHNGTRNIYLAFYNATKGVLEPWILPVATTPGIHETPLHVVVLAGSPNKIVVIALEGDSLVAYYISPEYPELLNPIPIPEPWFIAAVVVIVAFITLVLFIKKARIG